MWWHFVSFILVSHFWNAVLDTLQQVPETPRLWDFQGGRKERQWEVVSGWAGLHSYGQNFEQQDGQRWPWSPENQTKLQQIWENLRATWLCSEEIPRTAPILFLLLVPLSSYVQQSSQDLNLLQPENMVLPVTVAHTCNPSCSGGRDQEDHSSKPGLGK
jgi:hypothetical protein